jgi:outer membrane biosynthesis protein TonB
MAKSKAEQMLEEARKKNAGTTDESDTGEMDALLGEIMGADMGDAPPAPVTGVTTIEDAPPPAPAPEPAPEVAPKVTEVPEPEPKPEPKAPEAPRRVTSSTQAEMEAGRKALERHKR